MAKKKEIIKSNELQELYDDFVSFCPKLTKVVPDGCKFDEECVCGKCLLKWYITYHCDCYRK